MRITAPWTLAAMLLATVLCDASARAADGKPATHELTLDEFVNLAASRDSEFEEILIEELTLRYERDLRLPPADLVLNVRQTYDAFPSQDRGGATTQISLNRLFPMLGTEFELAYEAGPLFRSDIDASAFVVGISQPIARNAFGRSTQLLDKIVGLEVDVARFQIIEAYEDYLATIMEVYYSWYEDYENLRVGQSSYRENLKLLKNIRARAKQKIALPIDVNKVRLQVLGKKERLVELEEALANSLQIVETIIRQEGDLALQPVAPAVPGQLQESIDTQLEVFNDHGRTFAILRLLERTSSLEVDREADDLLPSINLLAGHEVQGRNHGLDDSENRVFAGIEVEFPYPHVQQRAELGVARVFAEKSRLTTQNTYYRLRQQLAGLRLEMAREAQLAKIADEQIALARKVVRDETENYSFGKVTLNDYIQAVNILDNSRFSKILHESLLRRRQLEWQRLTDTLVGPSEAQAN